MSRNFDGALVMPKGHSVMNRDEMTYVEGGHQVTLTKRFLVKSNCENEASDIIKNSLVSGMTQTEIAKEIYAHAVALYKCWKMVDVFGLPIALYCYNKAKDGIVDLDDGGDTALRRLYYNIAWSKI